MSASASASCPIPASRALRRLFLTTLFLRGRSARGLQRGSTPKSVASKLAMVLGFYALFGGLMSVSFIGRSHLHAFASICTA